MARESTRLSLLPLLLASLLLLPACAGDDDDGGFVDPRDRSPGHQPAPQPPRGGDVAADGQTPADDQGDDSPSAADATENQGDGAGAGAGDDGLSSTDGDDADQDGDGGQPDPTRPPPSSVNCFTGFGPEDFATAPACELYAQSPSRLYRVDPWRGTANDIGPTTGSMFDIDTAPDGTLYGVAQSALHRYNAGTGQWTRVGALNPAGVNPNGLCINSFGEGYVTSGNQLYAVDLATGRTEPAVNAIGGGFSSSGDCVIDKGNAIYMSSSNLGGNDDLVLITPDGRGQLIGRTNHRNIYGLTAAWGRLFGTTGEGHIIEIDYETGASTELHRLPSINFYGAASAPLDER